MDDIFGRSEPRPFRDRGTVPKHHAPDFNAENVGTFPGRVQRLMELDGRSEVLTADLERVLRDDHHLVNAFSLTTFDLAYAVVNGMSDECSYILPPPPFKAKDSTKPKIQELIAEGELDPNACLVTLEEQGVFFQHCLRAALRRGIITPEDVTASIDQGMLVATFDTYESYLNILQETARIFAANRDKFLDSTSELLAGLSYKGIPNGACFGATPSGIQLNDLLSDGKTLTLKLSGNVLGVGIELAPGGSIIIPGAGLSSMLGLGIMAHAPNTRFVLNDNDPFIGKVLEKVVGYLGAPNIEVSTDDMSDLRTPPSDYASVLLSNCYTADPKAVSAALSTIRRNSGMSLVYAYHPDSPERSPGFHYGRLQQVLGDAGYRIVAEASGEEHSRSLVPTSDPEFVRNMLGGEIMGYMQPTARENAKTVGHFLIAASN